MANENNNETMKNALEFWQQRNAPILTDPESKKQLSKTPQQILHTYMQLYGHDYETICDELDWKYFESNSAMEEVFGNVDRAFSDNTKQSE